VSSASEEFLTALEALVEDLQRSHRKLPADGRITPVQIIVLRWVGAPTKGEVANLSALAGFLGVRPQTVTAIVDGLEKAGWVRRTRTPTDRREVRLELTASGRRTVAAAHASFFALMGEALDGAPAESLRRGAEALRIAAAHLQRLPPLRPPSASA